MGFHAPPAPPRWVKRSSGANHLEIDLITTGDNDDDGFNEELDLEVTGTGIVL